MLKKQSTKLRTKVTDIPKKEKKLTPKNMKKVKGGLIDLNPFLDLVKDPNPTKTGGGKTGGGIK